MTNETVAVPLSALRELTTASKALASAAEKLTKLVSKNDDQSWYWTKEWQKAEREADEDIKAGRVKSFSNVEDLIEELNS